jgi:UDP-N-acetyl-D-mannosaminuronic acid dehydrogenase
MDRPRDTICVIGLGYIGLPTAAAFAACGLNVVGVDTEVQIVETINRGEIHFIEPELDKVVHAAVSSGHLHATTSPIHADAFLIAVPTPFKENHEPDLQHIEAACKSIGPVLKKGDLVILESTVPVGATEQMTTWLAAARPDLKFPTQAGSDADIHVAHCPERVLTGRVMRELTENNRIIGGLTPECSEAAAALYRIVVKGECIITNARTAEMCKLAENAFRDVNIAFANELSVICDNLCINVWELIKLANRHPRVNVLQPGPGVGGHCIAVDPWFIISADPAQAPLMRTARLVNDSKQDWVVEKVISEVKKSFTVQPKYRFTIACFGLAFKADIDDLRQSPAVTIALKLAEMYPEQVVVVEPYVNSLPAPLLNKKVRLLSIEEALATAEILVMLVDHSLFRQIDSRLLRNKTIVDTKGIWI